jgi:hypothetical protein
VKSARAGWIESVLLVLLSVVGYGTVFRNAAFLSTDVLLGDGSGQGVFPRPAFDFYRLPDTALTRAYEADGRLALDFAQVYFPSRSISSLAENYETGALEPAGRPSRYAPLIHHACAVSLCGLQYGYASLLHIWIQVLLFYASLVAALLMLNEATGLRIGLLVTSLYLFVTPAGLGWFERGQFSLYVGASYLLLMLGLLKNRLALVTLSAVLTYVKWTSLPFVFVLLSLYLLSSRSMREALQKARPALLYLLVWIVLSLPFMTQLVPFLNGLYTQERFEIPKAFSLVRILPMGLVKASPLLLVLVGYVYLRENDRSFERLLPYLVGSGMLLMTYPTLTFEYSLPILLAFIPPVFYWTSQLGRKSRLIRFAFVGFLFALALAHYLTYAGLDAGLIILGGCLLAFLASLFHPLLARGKVAAPA